MEEFADQLLELARQVGHGNPLITMLTFVGMAASAAALYWGGKKLLAGAARLLGKRVEAVLPGHKIKAVGESLAACQKALGEVTAALDRHRSENDELRAVLDQVRERADRAAAEYLRLLAEHTAAKLELAHYRDRYGPLQIPALTR